VIIENLFPTAVSFFDLGRSFTDAEMSCVKNQPLKDNTGNKSSINTKLLNAPELTNIAEFVNKAVAEYVATVYLPANDIEVYIKQSWGNVTNPGQYHHKHSHPNSFLSGVLYFHAEKNIDKITFFKNELAQLKLKTNNWNLFNSESWYFPVETGKLVLFPSTLQHMVTTTESKEPRISLAFNTFLRGDLGDEHDLTRLILEK
jgi:uncharacterized protein (TIGR02466 family)